MKAHTTFIKYMAAAMVSTVALQGCGGSPAGNSQDESGVSAGNQLQQGEELFSEAEAGAEAQIQSEREEPSLRKRLVRVNFGLLKRVLTGSSLPATLKLNLFSDRTIEVTIEDVQKISDNNIVATGRITGDIDSAVSLVMNNGVLLANIKYGDKEESFEIRYGANGVHEVRVPDESQSEELPCEPVEPGPEGSAGDAAMGDGELASPLATPVIDMLVAYTPKARSYQGGTDAMLALIQMGIADTNRAFADSGVNLQVRLVGTLETKSNETSFSSDLSALRSKTDSRFNEVHPARARLGADQVTLVGAYTGVSGTAGIGYVNASASSAFTVVKASYFRMYTFSHELGHNIGLNHSDGYVNSTGKFRTIIAYGSYPRIRRYSNPNLPYNGYKTGDTSHNEAKILNANGARTAGLVSSVVPLSTL